MRSANELYFSVKSLYSASNDILIYWVGAIRSCVNHNLWSVTSDSGSTWADWLVGEAWLWRYLGVRTASWPH